MATTTRKKRPTKAQIERRKKADEARKARSRRYQLAAVILFGTAALSMALTFVNGNEGWNILSSFLFGLFGFCAYFIGPLLLALAVVCSYEKQVSNGKLILALLIVISICAMFLIFSSSEVAGENIFQKIASLYMTGTERVGGGVFSAILGLLFLELFGKPAANIVISIVLFILVMILAGKSLADVINAVKTPIDRQREKWREQRELVMEFQEEFETEQLQKQNTAALNRTRNTTSIDIPLDNVGKKANKTNTVSNQAVLQAVTAQTAATSKIDINLDSLPEVKSKVDVRFDDPIEAVDLTRIMPITSITGQRNIDIDLGSPTKVVSNDMFQEFKTYEDPMPQDSGDYINDANTGEFVKQAFDLADRIGKPGKDLFATFGSEEESANVDALIQRATKNIEPQKTSEYKPQQPEIALFKSTPEYLFPPIGMLEPAKQKMTKDASAELRANAEYLVSTLESFGVGTKVVDIARGPTVTRYELQPERGVRINRIANLADDIALNLATAGVRIEAPIPNKAAVGIEVPNKQKEMVMLREVIESKEFNESKSPLTVALGKDISGSVQITDIAKMPHLLIAGTTGSGKSKCLHSMIVSLIYKSAPKDLRFVFIDPKMVEFGIYNGIPHMLIPVVTDARKAAGALGWAVGEMLKRYKLFSENAVRDIDSYNTKIENANSSGMPIYSSNEEDAVPLEKLPRVVVVIDELADLMLVAPNEVEDSICRLAQMARAAGIHLIIATQRPSVDVITGIIKANIASRVALSVSSQIDSRTIIDTGGAEKLLGYGDMLFRPMDLPKAIRIQGCFVSDGEIEDIITFIKKNAVAEYNEEVLTEIEKQAAMEKGSKGKKSLDSSLSDDSDAMLESAVMVVIESGQASTSLLQRRLKLGYARAARIMDEMESLGIIGPSEGSKPRTVNINAMQWNEMKQNMQ